MTLEQPEQGNLYGRSSLTTGFDVAHAGHGIVGTMASSISTTFNLRGLIIAVNHQITMTVVTAITTKIGGNAK